MSSRKTKASLSLFAAAASLLVQAEDKVSLQYLNYQENDNRISVDDWAISIESNPNVNHQIKVTAGLDTISGASPAWQSKTTSFSAPDSAITASSSNIYGVDSTGYEIKKVTVPEEERKSAGISWLSRNKKRHELSLGMDYSEEPDYISRSASANYMWFADRYKNRSYSIGSSIQSNQSLAFNSYYQTHWEDLTATNVQLGISQVMSQRSVIDGNIFINYDNGYLTNHYQTILRQFDGNGDGIVETYLAAEQRPSERQAYGFASKWLMQWSATVSSHLNMRLYQDDWGINSQTFGAKSYLNIVDGWTFHLLARFYQQSQADFYKDPEKENAKFAITGYGSADHRLGTYSASTFELGIAYEWKKILITNLQLGHYEQTSGFAADWISSGLTVKY